MTLKCAAEFVCAESRKPNIETFLTRDFCGGIEAQTSLQFYSHNRQLLVLTKPNYHLLKSPTPESIKAS